MIFDRGEAEVNNHIREANMLYYRPLRNVIFILFKRTFIPSSSFTYSKIVNYNNIIIQLMETKNTCCNMTSDSQAMYRSYHTTMILNIGTCLISVYIAGHSVPF